MYRLVAMLSRGIMMIDLSQFADKDFIKAMETINNQHEADKKRIAELEKKLAEYSKEEEVARLNAKVKDVRKRSVYVMNDRELATCEAFRTKHEAMHSKVLDFYYREYRTYVDNWLCIRCPECGEEKDVY